MKRVLALFFCACSYHEVDVPQQGLMTRAYDLQPAVPTYVDTRCHKRWDVLHDGQAKDNAAVWDCENELAGLEGCFAWYCDATKCDAALDTYAGCLTTHLAEWEEAERQKWTQQQNQFPTPVVIPVHP